MDEGKGKSAEIEEWMMEFLPDIATDVGMGRGVTLPSSSLNNSNQHNKAISLRENYQVAAMTPNVNPNVWLPSPRASVRPSVASSLPTVLQEFPQSSSNMIPKLRQQQMLQNQVPAQVAERPNVYQLPLQSSIYPSNLRPHQPVQQTSPGFHSTSLMVKPQESFNVLQHTNQATLQNLEKQSGLAPTRVHPKLHMPGFHQPQNLMLVDQLKPGNQPQTMLVRPSQALFESTSQVELTNSNDWIDPVFQKILRLKEIYLPEVIMLINKAREMRRRATNVETGNKWDKTRVCGEKIFKFLNSSRSDLLTWRKEKLYQAMDDLIRYLGRLRPGNSLHVEQSQQVEGSGSHLEALQMQQRVNYPQLNNTSASLHQSLRQGGASSLPDSSVNSFKVGSSAGVPKFDASSILTSRQYNPMRSAHQWAPQGSVVPSPQKGTQIGYDQISLRMLLHPKDGVARHNNLGTSQQMVTSSGGNFSTFSPTAQSSIFVSPQNNKQEPAMKRQKMKQPVQQLLTEKNNQQMLHKRNEVTDLRRLVGLNQKWSPLPPPSSSPYTVSPQNSQQSSSQLELKDLSSKLSKSGTPSMSLSSSALASPLTPLTPSSVPADSAKSPSAAPAQVSLQATSQNEIVTDTQGLLKSSLHAESTCPGDKQSSCANEEPVKRLVEVVKSISSRALHATLRDIDAFTSLTDRMGHHLHGESTKVIYQDLADDISNSVNGSISLVNSMTTKSTMQRQLDSITLNDFTTETEFCPSGRMKRLKKEPYDLLLQEIKEINQKFVEVVAEVMNVKDISRTESEERTLVRCSYIPVGISGNVSIPNTSKQMFPNLPLELIVPADYPNSSPTVLVAPLSGCRGDDEEGGYLWMKVMSKFSLSVRRLSQPMSLKEMVETWNICAREAFLQFAEQRGGGDFSSRYGKWENFVVAV